MALPAIKTPKIRKKHYLRALGIIIGVFVLIMVIVYAYVSANKKKIIDQVTSEISKKINGKVSIGNVELSFIKNFPSVSVLIHDVKVTDSMYAQHHHPFFEAKEVFALLSIRRLFKKQPPLNGIRVDNASLYIYTDSTGYTNNYLMKPKDKGADNNKAAGDKTALEYIILKNVRFVVEDQPKTKLHSFLVKKIDAEVEEDNADALKFSIKANLLVESMIFKAFKGSYLRGKTFESDFKMLIDKKQQQLKLDSINIKLGGHPFNLSASFQLSGADPQFSLRLHTKKAGLEDIKTFLPERIQQSLSIVKLSNTVDADASIAGPLKGGDPLVYISWSAKGSKLTTPLLEVDDASFKGYFVNEVTPGLPRKDPNSKIVVTDLTARWHELPLNVKNLEVLDLSNPTLSCDLQSSFPLTAMNDIIGSNSLQFSEGNADVNMNYKGPLKGNDSTNSFLNGTMSFKNGSMLYVPRNVEFKNMQASLTFKNSDVFLNNLQANILNNKFVMNATAKKILTVIDSGPNYITIDWNIYCPTLNLSSISYLLQPRKQASKSGNKKVIAKVASGIDNMLDQGRLNVQLKTDHLVYNNFKADHVVANVSILSDRYLINGAGMGHSGGNLSLNGSLIPGPRNNDVKINMDMNNVNASSLLHAFDNFGQDAITHKNIDGRLTAKANVSLGLDQAGKVNPSSLVGTVDFSLKDGGLYKFEPIKKLQKLVFKKRDFDSIHFAELKNRLEIADREIKINRMEIQSTVLSMFVEGVYSMKGNTDIRIQVPLNNLKKRDSTYIPENIGVDKKGGRSIFVHGTPGPDGNIKFNLEMIDKAKTFLNKLVKPKKNKD